MLLYSFRIVCTAALALLAAAPALAAGTAREALKEVAAAAQKWQSDAVLTHVSTLRGFGDGRAIDWLYMFYSPKANKSAIVTAKDKAVTDVTADVRNTSMTPLGADFVDSDRAVEAAVKAGMKIDKTTKNLGYGLVVGNQAVGKPQLFWTVTQFKDDGMSAVILNGKDAALLRRDEQKFK